MKKIIAFVFALVLTAALLPGCGCRNSKPMDTLPTTRPTTAPTTAPTTQPTVATSRETIEDGNGPLPTNATAGADGNTADATEDTGLTGEARGRNSTQSTGTNMR